MHYIILLMGIGGLVFTYFWLKNPDDAGDRSRAVLSLVGSIVMVLLGLFLIFNDL